MPGNVNASFELEKYMKCSCTPAGMPAGQPFEDRNAFLLWLAGIDLGSQDFATQEEAIAAAQQVLAMHPDLTFTVEA